MGRNIPQPTFIYQINSILKESACDSFCKRNIVGVMMNTIQK